MNLISGLNLKLRLFQILIRYQEIMIGLKGETVENDKINY
jgi:hypothetical protein